MFGLQETSLSRVPNLLPGSATGQADNAAMIELESMGNLPKVSCHDVFDVRLCHVHPHGSNKLLPDQAQIPTIELEGCPSLLYCILISHAFCILEQLFPRIWATSSTT